MKTALIVVLALTTGAAAQVGDLNFPITWQLGDRTLVLNGAGVREYGVFGIDVYAAALYLPKRMHDARAVLNYPGSKVLHMRALRSASAKDTARAWEPYLHDNCDADCDYPSAQAARFLNMLPETVAGETQTYVFIDGAVEMMRNGQSLGRIEGKDFARLLLSTWIGEVPTSETLKASLLGRR